MPQQITQLLEILSADSGGEVGVRVEVGDDGEARLVASDAQGRAVFLFRPATLQIGAEGHAGALLIRDQDGGAVLFFNGSSAELKLGTLENPGEVILTGNLEVLDSLGRQILHCDSAEAHLNIGGSGQQGLLTVKDGRDQDAFHFSAFGAELRIGGSGNAGELAVCDAQNRVVFFFRSDFAELKIGEQGNAGNLIVLDDEGREVVRGNGENGTVFIGSEGNGGTLLVRGANGHNALSFDTGGNPDDPFAPKGAFVRIGTRESPGELEIRDDQDRPALNFSSANARLDVGTGGKAGRLVVRDANGEAAVVITSVAAEPGVALAGTAPSPADGTARVRIGGPRTHGELEIEDGNGRAALRFGSDDSATLRFGSRDREGRLIIKNSEDREVFSFESDKALLHIGSNGEERITIDGTTGDIRFKNADVAEQFDVVEDADSSPGTVMVLGDDQRLRPSSGPYDRRVVGVVAGAGAYRPGIVMDAKNCLSNRVAISLFGKASCKADATEASIAIGDLLTSSALPGYAMKAGDPYRAFGAVIGKALTPLDEGVGFIEMLIALQ